MSDSVEPWSINALMARIAPAAREDFDAVYPPMSRLPSRAARPPRKKPARRLTPEEREERDVLAARRREAVYARRRGGAKFTDLARELHVTAPRVREMFRREERRLMRRPLTAEHVAVLREIVGQLEPLA